MRSILLALTLTLATAGSVGCGGTSQTVTSPSTVKCAVTAAAEPASFGPPGGTGTLSITTNRECQWSASANGGWIQLGSASSGQGDGKVDFSVAANSDPAVRRGAIAVGDHQVAITQEAAPCTFRVSPASDSVPPEGGRRTLTVTASSALCTWTARSEADWLTIVEGAQGTGNGQVVFDVRATNGPARSGTLTVAGQTIGVTQGIGCAANIGATTQAVGASGGSGSVAVDTAPGCPWTAASQVNWITIAAGSSGSGPGEVRFSASANTGPERTGTLTIAGRTFTVTQAAGCTYSISPASQSFASGGGGGSIAVTTGGGCSWTASASQSWVQITSGSSASGSSTVQFSVQANGGPARTATITVAGHSFTVQQSSGCSYSLGSSSSSVPAEGGTGSVSVTTGPGCTWGVSSADAWLRLTSPPPGAGGTAEGTGPGTVQFAADPNTGAPRTGTLSIAGQTHTVSQGGVACSFSINPTSQLFDAAGGTGSFELRAPGHCSWTATSSQGWLQITGGAGGSGNGTVSFSAVANTGPSRTATISAGGQTFTATQNSGCVVTISPAGQNFPLAGGTGTITVTAGDGCGWTAAVTLGTEWITIASGAGGTGPGSVTFTVAETAGPPRSGTITIAGQTFTVSQGI